jgi:hypothetical protein
MGRQCKPAAEYDMRVARGLLQRARDANLAPARALKLDRASLAEATEEELKELEKLAEQDPALVAEIEALTAKLEAEYAAIPPIQVKVQPVDEKDNPVGEPYTITSKDGVLDLGYTALTSPELLLLVQTEEAGAERGLAIGSDWSHSRWGSGDRWPNATVKFFFDSSISLSEEQWMDAAMERITAGTGMRFTEVADSFWNHLLWTFFLADFAKIAKVDLDDAGGTASAGKRWQSFLYMDPAYVTSESTFDHEMGHLFGSLHEHQRDDRDGKVLVETTGSNYNRIPLRRRHCAFLIFWCEYVTNTTCHGTPYDFRSVMHYQSCGYIADGIRLKNNKYWVVYRNNKRDWGSVNGDTYFTPWDIYTIKRLYGMTSARRPTYTPTAGTEYSAADCPR